MTRSSTPSKRPATISTPGPDGEVRHERLVERPPARAHQQTRARVARRARRVDRRAEHVGAHHHARAAARRRVVDRAVLVGRRRRGCRAPRATKGPRRAPRPARLAPSGPGNISGKRVSTRRAEGHAARPSSPPISPGGGSTTTRPPATSTSGTAARVNGTSDGLASRRRDFEEVAGAVIAAPRRPFRAPPVDRLRRQGRSGRRGRTRPSSGCRQARAGHRQLDAVQRLGCGRGRRRP